MRKQNNAILSNKLLEHFTLYFKIQVKYVNCQDNLNTILWQAMCFGVNIICFVYTEKFIFIHIFFLKVT